MMKKTIYFFIVAIIGFNFISCNDDLLDNRPLDKFSELDIWNDDDLATAYIYDVYASAIGRYVKNTTDEWTDNILNNSNNGSWGRNVQNSAFDNNKDFGWNQYGTIRKCNVAIEKLQEEESQISEPVKERLLGEAKMMRGMIYFWVARRFGGVMLVDKVLTESDDLQLPRATERETYDFILADLQNAATLLPDDAEKGRLTSGAASAFITMVALQIGDYDAVIDAANEVENKGYSLEPEYKDLFNAYETTVASNEVIILYHDGEDGNTYRSTTRMFEQIMNASNGGKLRADAFPQFSDEDDFQGWPELWPSQELVDSYLVVEGGVAVEKKMADHQGEPSADMWLNRDDRLEHSIVHDNTTYSKSLLTFRVGGNAHWTSNPASDLYMPKSGYMFRKWMYENNYIYWNHRVSWAEPILRLGEVYLNKAEAYGRKGDLANAILYMNKTRETHGGLPALDAGSSEADFWKFYKIERRVELAVEDDRYWSLIRWARAEGATSIPELDGYTQLASDMQADGLVNIVESTYGIELNFEVPKRFFFGIRDSELLENTNLTQNPGW